MQIDQLEFWIKNPYVVSALLDIQSEYNDQGGTYKYASLVELKIDPNRFLDFIQEEVKRSGDSCLLAFEEIEEDEIPKLSSGRVVLTDEFLKKVYKVGIENNFTFTAGVNDFLCDFDVSDLICNDDDDYGSIEFIRPTVEQAEEEANKKFNRLTSLITRFRKLDV